VSDSPPLRGQYFDGRSARAQAVTVSIEDGHLVARGSDTWRWPLKDVQWPETTRHGQRLLLLADGGQITVADAAAFDRWRQAQGRQDAWVVRAQQSWRAVGLALLLVGVVLWGGYRWGVPVVAQAVVALVPAAADQAVGESALAAIGERWLKPSQLPPERQQALRQRFEAAAGCGMAAPPFRVLFHDGGDELGPNAFALPGGTIVMTDAMVTLLHDRDDTLLGVFGHELGHVRHRHGMRALVQVGLLSAAASVVLGDFSSWLAAAPALLGQLDYSRAAEREADEAAALLLRCNGVNPAVMVALFDRLRQRGDGNRSLPVALASHPADEERVAFFRAGGREADR
jgi:Zn-dependent protease with chaperone function